MSKILLEIMRCSRNQAFSTYSGPAGRHEDNKRFSIVRHDCTATGINITYKICLQQSSYIPFC